MSTELYKAAEEFIATSYKELKKTNLEIEERLEQIKKEIETTELYEHTIEELSYGAKMAWRNSNRCIGRLFWESLHVIDKRHLSTEEEIKEALLEHIEYATNGGKIRPLITIFSQELPQQKIRIWNHQLIRYAGYETKDGVIGDPDSICFTKVCESLGWRGRQSNFDVLPLVIQVNEQKPKWFSIPDELILEVPLRHPEYQWFKELELKWYAVPMISSMLLEIGGIRYTAAPFNGWYMGTEIGARNLADEGRYNMLPLIASHMGLDVTRNINLWKDRALVELNTAVLYSYKEDGVNIVDHHTAAQQFKLFEEREIESKRSLTGNWNWLIPPMAPAATHIWHKSYDNEIKTPNYFNQRLPY